MRERRRQALKAAGDPLPVLKLRFSGLSRAGKLRETEAVPIEEFERCHDPVHGRLPHDPGVGNVILP